MRDFFSNLRLALRRLRLNLRVSIVAVAILSIGLSAGTVVFSLVRAVLLKPLPVESPEQVVALFARSQNGWGLLALPDFDDYRRWARNLEDLAAYTPVEMALGSGRSERILGHLVTSNYFSTLGVDPAYGSFFGPESVNEGPPVVVLSQRLWQRNLAADPQLVGTDITLNGRRFTVLGIAAEEFEGTDPENPASVWLPLAFHRAALPDFGSELMQSRETQWLNTIGRLAPGSSPNQARQELRTLSHRLAEAFPESHRGWSVEVLPAAQGTTWPPHRASTERLLRLAIVGAGLLLLIVCSNVAGLLLVHSTRRMRELGIRVALGARRPALLREALLDSCVLGLLAGLVGVALARAALRLLSSSPFSAQLPLGARGQIDWQTLLFGLVLAGFAAVLSSVGPVAVLLKSDLRRILISGGTLAAGSRARAWFQKGFAVAQVAVAIALMVGGALILRTWIQVRSLSLGFSTERVLLASMDLGLHGISESEGPQLFDRILERVRTLPGVESAGLAAVLPMTSGRFSQGVVLPGYEPQQQGYTHVVSGNVVGGQYFQALRIPLVEGRGFTSRDQAGSPKTVVVNQAFATLLGGEQATVGRRFALWSPDGESPVEIVGVVKNTRHTRFVTDELEPHFYLPLAQHYEAESNLVVRTSTDPKISIPSLRDAVRNVRPNLLLFNLRTFDEQVQRSLAPERFAGGLLGSFGLLSLLFSLLGVYSVVSYVWAQRTREIGLRMALGATRRDLLRSVLGHGALLAGLGLVPGLLLAWPVTRILSGLLYRVSPLDPVSLVAASLLVTLGCTLATVLPALRAARLDPSIALKER